MRKIVEYVLLVIFLVVIAIFTFKVRQSYKALQNKITTLQYNFDESKIKYDDLNKIYLNTSKIIPKDFLLNLRKGNSEKTVVAFFNEYNCGTCVKEIIIELEKFSNKYNNRNVVLVSNVKTADDFFKPMGGMKEDDFQYIFIENNETFSDFYSLYPVLLVINNLGEIIHIFVPELQKEQSEHYYSNILPMVLESQYTSSE